LLEATTRPWAGVEVCSTIDALYLSERLRRWGGDHWATVAWRLRPELALIPQEAIDLVYRLGPSDRENARFQKWAIALLDPQGAGLPNNGGYSTRPLPSILDRARDRSLDARKLLKKLYDRHLRPAGTEVRALELPTYASVFPDLLDLGSLQTASLFDPQELERTISAARTDRLSSNAPFNAILSLEWAVRQAGLRL
jgi:hypothetical protein